MRKILGSTLLSVAFLAPTLVVAQPAQAFTQTTDYSVLDKSKYATKSPNFSDRLSSCFAGSTGVDCTLTVTASATRTVGLSLGVSRGFVSGQLSISGSTTQSVSAACTKKDLTKGQSLVAYSIGDRYSYKVKRVITTIDNGYYNQSTSTSGTLNAFDPYKSSIYCRVES